MSIPRLTAALVAVAAMLGACGGSTGESATTQEAPDADGGAADGTAEPLTTVVEGDSGPVAVYDSLLDKVKRRGHLSCGVYGAAVAFSETQADGSQKGFDVDFCRAVTVAILGDTEAVVYVPLTSAERFLAVQTGVVDVLFRNTTWTQSRDFQLGLDFGPVTYYDGQQLMARAADGYTKDSTVADIAGAVVCANAGTTTEKNIADAAKAAGVEITLNTFEDLDIITGNFIAGACDIMTTDGSGLVGRKNTIEPDDQEWVIFPSKPISKEPLAPAYAQNDSRFADVINWVVYATIIADEKGITQDGVDAMVADPPDAEAARLLGLEGALQTAMGLAPDAFYQVIKQVGNYNDIFERHLVPVGLSRQDSANASWRDGGLIYAPPAR